MMDAMPRPRPPHLHAETTRHGKRVWYVRRGHDPRVRIRAQFGTAEFDHQYQAALAGKAPESAKLGSAPAGSLAWLWERYRETTAWTKLSLATRRQRENIMVHVLETAGTKHYVKITQADIISGRERRGDTPAQSRNFLDCVRGLFRWALKAKHVKTDPTAGVENPPRSKGPGFKKWTEADGEAYERRWPIGTKERVWYDVLCFTGVAAAMSS